MQCLKIVVGKFNPFAVYYGVMLRRQRIQRFGLVCTYPVVFSVQKKPRVGVAHFYGAVFLKAHCRVDRSQNKLPVSIDKTLSLILMHDGIIVFESRNTVDRESCHRMAVVGEDGGLVTEVLDSEPQASQRIDSLILKR